MPEEKKSIQKLLEFQKEVESIKKDTKHPHFKCNYFDINKLLEEVKPLLNKIGLVIAQPLTNLDGKPAIKTMLIDANTSEVVYNEVMPLIELPKPQDMGSCITYYRRYALQSLLCLQAEDDDGEKAMGRGNTPAVTRAPAQSNTEAKKQCPYCNVWHQGTYPKCVACWKKEQNGEKLAKTKTVVNEDVEPFPDSE